MYRTAPHASNALGLAVIAATLGLCLLVMLPLVGAPALRLLASTALALAGA